MTIGRRLNDVLQVGLNSILIESIWNLIQNCPPQKQFICYFGLQILKVLHYQIIPIFPEWQV